MNNNQKTKRKLIVPLEKIEEELTQIIKEVQKEETQKEEIQKNPKKIPKKNEKDPDVDSKQLYKIPNATKNPEFEKIDKKLAQIAKQLRKQYQDFLNYITEKSECLHKKCLQLLKNDKRLKNQPLEKLTTTSYIFWKEITQGKNKECQNCHKALQPVISTARTAISFVIKNYYPQALGITKNYIQKWSKHNRNFLLKINNSDLISQLSHNAISGLIEAFLNYDPSQNVNFSAYCLFYSKRNTIQTLKNYFNNYENSTSTLSLENLNTTSTNPNKIKNKNYENMIASYYKQEDDDSEDISKLVKNKSTIISLEKTPYEKNLQKIIEIKKAIEQYLTPLESFIIKEFYFNEKSVKEILENLKKNYPYLTERYIFNIKNKAINKLKRIFCTEATSPKPIKKLPKIFKK